MLEAVVTAWAAAHGAGGARVLMTPPDTFYPLWDGRQAATFRERCSDDALARPREAPPSEPTGDDDGRAAPPPVPRATLLAVCRRLVSEGFAPRVPPDGISVSQGTRVYAAHHWAHTWLVEDATTDWTHDEEVPPDVARTDQIP